jgi:hypothetical protein
MKTIAALAAGLLLATTAVASAHSNQARLEEQSAAIELGRRDGGITWREGIKLRKQQALIARRKSELEADGRLSRSDRRELHSLQDEAQTTIVREHNDSWRRLWFLPRVGR